MRIKKQSSWEIQKAVIFALFVRELRARFGRFRLGYAWAVLEPLALIAVLSGLRVFWGRSDIAGLPYPLFFASGIMPFLLFQHILNDSLNAVESNQGLFNYQRVKPADSVFSKVLLETLITFFTGILIFVGMYLLGLHFTWNNTLAFVLTMTLLVMFSTGLGLCCSVIAPLWQDSKKIIPVIIRPFFFISGIMFPAGSVPQPYRDYMLLNPLLHVSELVRGSMFVEYQNPMGDIGYLGFCSLVSLMIGLMVYRKWFLRVQTSGYIR